MTLATKFPDDRPSPVTGRGDTIQGSWLQRSSWCRGPAHTASLAEASQVPLSLAESWIEIAQPDVSPGLWGLPLPSLIGHSYVLCTWAGPSEGHCSHGFMG